MGGESLAQNDRDSFGVDPVDELRRSEGCLATATRYEYDGEREQTKPASAISHRAEAGTLGER
jgi:hypothetical protein